MGLGALAVIGIAVAVMASAAGGPASAGLSDPETILTDLAADSEMSDADWAEVKAAADALLAYINTLLE